MLEKIVQQNDLKKIAEESLPEVAEKIRGFLIWFLSFAGAIT